MFNVLFHDGRFRPRALVAFAWGCYDDFCDCPVFSTSGIPGSGAVACSYGRRLLSSQRSSDEWHLLAGFEDILIASNRGMSG